jgi:O-antigen/teichoic acid export membrane protein
MWAKIKEFLFQNRTNRQTVAKNTFWLGVSNIGGRALRAVIIIFSARLLGAADWGVFSYALTLAAFLTTFIDLGVNQIIVRELVKNQEPAGRIRIISTAFFIKMILLAFGILVVLGIAPHFATLEGAADILPWVALILAFDSLRDFGSALCRALERMEWEATLALITNLVIVAAGFLLLSASPTVHSLALAYAIGTGIGMAATFVALRRQLGGLLSNFHRPLVRLIALAAWPFAISGLLGALMINTDILVIGWLLSAADVGFYSAAQRIVQILYILPNILAVSALPTFSRLAGRDPQKFRRVLEGLMALAFLIAIPLMVGGALLGSRIIALLFGPEYAPATLSFQILMITLVVDFPAVLLANAIFAHDRQKNLIIYAAIGGFANLTLDLLFIPRWGIAGAAAATLFCQIASNIYLWSVMKKLSPFQVIHRLRKIAAAALAMGVAVILLTWINVPVLITIALGGVLYLGALYVLREPLIDEARLLLGQPDL